MEQCSEISHEESCHILKEESCQASKKDTKNVCLFCNMHRRKVKGRMIDLGTTANKSTFLKSNATILNDIDLLRYIGNSLAENQYIKYHKLCKVQYENKWHVTCYSTV